MKEIYYILVLLCLVGCTKHDRAQRKDEPMRVHTMVIRSQSARSVSRYVGTIEAVQTTPLSMQATGRVVAVYAKNGQRVAKGQTILEVDATQARHALEAAEATLRHAQDGYDRVHKVHDKGVVSDQKMVEVESQLAQARSTYEIAKQHLAECSLVAPCEGVLDGLDLAIGQTVLPGTRLCDLLDVSAFSVRFSVPEKEMNGLRDEWMKGEVEVKAVDATFPIEVTEKGITANALTHTYEVVAKVQGGKDVLMSGMVAVVKVQSSIVNRPIVNETVIPARCVLLKPEGPTVWIMENGQAVRRSVAIDGYQADGVRVTEGLHEGDTLIIDGYQKLYNGCAVVDS